MTSISSFLLGLLCLFGLYVVAARAARQLLGSDKLDRRVSEIWRLTAHDQGLQFIADNGHGSFAIEGVYRGIDVYLSEVPVDDGRQMQLHARCETPLPKGFSLAPEGAKSAIRALLGNGDVLVGDKALDDALDLRGADPHAVRRLLEHEGVRQALAGILDDGFDPQLDQNGLLLVSVHRPESGSELLRWLDRAADLMTALNEAGR